jgi:hypothetical protein
MKYHQKSYDLENLPEWLTFLRYDVELTSSGIGFARLLKKGKDTLSSINMKPRKKFIL